MFFSFLTKNVHQILIALILFIALGSTTKAETADKDIVDTAVAAGSFTSLATALSSAGLIDTLKGEGPFTVFAPTDEAFAALPAETIEALLADPEALANVLTYHVLSGQVLAADVIAGGNTAINMLNGSQAQIMVNNGGVKIDDANIVQTDILASNGVIHVIDKVIVPTADDTSSGNTIVDLALASPELSTLVTALSSAGLVDTLNGSGPFTVFAPTNAAFAALPSGTLDSLLANPSELSKVLTHHVIASQIKSADLVASGVGSAETVNGSQVYYAATSNQVKVAESMVTVADIEASNGIIHIVDTVLIPPTDCQASYNLVSKVLTIPCINIDGEAHKYSAQLQETLMPSNFNIISIELTN